MGANAGAVCSLVPGLSRRQRKQCSLHPDAMEAVVRGVSLAIDECQRQFAHDRWNCSAVQNAGFGRILLKCKCISIDGMPFGPDGKEGSKE